MDYETLKIIVLAAGAIACFAIILIIAWRMRRDDPWCCGHEVQSNLRWTQDGWVTVCLICRDWIYHGDDYENPPA